MMKSALWSLLTVAGLASAHTQRLLVSSYKPVDPNVTVGAIQTLEFDAESGNGSLKLLHSNYDCRRDPTWLDLSLGDNTVLCLDEAIYGEAFGHLTKLAIQPDGSLKSLSSIDTNVGPVSLAIFRNKSSIALASYEPPSISTYDFAPNSTYSTFTTNKTWTDTDPAVNASAVRPHIHQAVVDPTGKFLVFPDLGADRLRIMTYGNSSNLTEADTCEGCQVTFPSKTGPRHAVFWTAKPTCASSEPATYLFLITELSNAIYSFKVTYPSNSIRFEQVDKVSTYGNTSTPLGAAAAELSLSPDSVFLIASNRNATLFQAPNPDPKNSTQIPSDSIATFKPSADGKLQFVQLAPSGGAFPRHFEVSKDGSLIAIANQNSFNVNIYKRNVETGLIGELLASKGGLGPGGLTNVRWLE